MTILRECKRLLILLGVSTETQIRIGEKHFPRFFSQLLTTGALALCTVFAILFSKQNFINGVTTILMSTLVAITYFSEMMIYICLLLKIREIVQLMDYLQHVYNKRNFCQIKKNN